MTGVILKDLEVNTALSSILKALESQQPFHKEKQSAQVCILGNNSNISMEGGGCGILTIILPRVQTWARGAVVGKERPCGIEDCSELGFLTVVE